MDEVMKERMKDLRVLQAPNGEFLLLDQESMEILIPKIKSILRGTFQGSPEEEARLRAEFIDKKK